MEADLATLIAPSCQAGVDQLGQPRGGTLPEGNPLQSAADLGGPAAHGDGRGPGCRHDGDANAGNSSYLCHMIAQQRTNYLFSQPFSNIFAQA